MNRSATEVPANGWRRAAVATANAGLALALVAGLALLLAGTGHRFGYTAASQRP
jgi:hypothetical protein